MTTPISVSAEEARRLILHLQGLGESHRRRLDDDQLMVLIDRLGFVQIDSINTVERAHHMILLARTTGYRKAQLKRLLERRRDLFENWTHDASVIPSTYFPYWRRRFENRRQSLSDRYSDWHGPEFLAETDRVLRHIEENGPVLSRELSPDERKGPGAWWNWHPSKTALEFLWRTGNLAICRRDGFQKVYDLTHRVIPPLHRSEPADHDAFVDWSCRTALDRLGFGTAGEIAGYWDNVTTDEAKAWCDARMGRDVAQACVVQADGRRRTLYARPDLEQAITDASAAPPALRILNPFDPVLRDRKRLNGLFSFDYRIEVFVPAPQRMYGYYVFPILEGDRMVGRIDMKADRQAGALSVTGLWSEPRSQFGAGRFKKLESELDRHRKFAGLDTVRFEDRFRKDQSL